MIQETRMSYIFRRLEDQKLFGKTMKMPDHSDHRASEWKRFLTVITAGVLTFLTLTGLSIYFLGFGESNQIMVLSHTVIGLLFVIPTTWYQIRHWRRHSTGSMTHVMLTGYFSTAAVIVAGISGLVLTYQAAFSTRIVYMWDLIHIVSTFAVIAAILAHVGWIVWRIFFAKKKESVTGIQAAIRNFSSGSIAIVVSLFILVAVSVWAYRPVVFNNTFPEDYSMLYGPDRPFAPSLAKTSTGGALDSRSLGGSQNCGTSGCHKQITQEWEVSAHRWSAMDPAFRAVQSIMGEQNGPESTRYCGGCHDPISLFSGSKNLFADDLTNAIGHDEGVSCIVCHGIKETDVQGNANYMLEQPDRYMFEMSETGLGRWTSNFLIRAYPKKHIESLQHKLFKSPEFCAACHKQFVDEEVNNVGWVQLQNQYDNWKNSRWHDPDDPTKNIECRECHMPLVQSTDPASGDNLDYNRTDDDGKHRSHRFLGANQFMPVHLKIPGGEEQVRLVEEWLRGDVDIPEIADKWVTGPAVPIELIVPETARPGEEISIAVSVTNNKLGHDFPTGPLDIIQAWIEVTVTDEDGREVFHSGKRDENHFIEPGTFMFKVEPVDQYGNLIDRHNLWEMVGVRYRRALFPGMSDQARFEFTYPGASTDDVKPLPEKTQVKMRLPRTQTTNLTVKARLLYRKVDQYMLNVLFGADSGLTSPISLISEAESRIVVRP
jgi:Cytochrome c554 and c-prime